MKLRKNRVKSEITSPAPFPASVFIAPHFVRGLFCQGQANIGKDAGKHLLFNGFAGVVQAAFMATGAYLGVKGQFDHYMMRFYTNFVANSGRLPRSGKV